MLARAHKKFQRGQHSEIYLLTLKKQDKTKMELPLDMVSISAFSCRTMSGIVHGRRSPTSLGMLIRLYRYFTRTNVSFFDPSPNDQRMEHSCA